MIHAESLLGVIGEGDLNIGGNTTGSLRSPGLLPRHYSPKAKLIVTTWTDEEELLARVATVAFPLEKTHVIAHTHIPLGGKFGRVAVIPHDPEAYARAIYAELHQCDEAGAELIVVEAVPDGPEWRGITDRLSRAAQSSP
jgi:L-threonylcarbamoyladenylate synthase